MRSFITYLSLSALISFAVTQNLSGQTVILYSNDFSTPITQPLATCSPDVDSAPVNDLWQGTGEGTGGGGAWTQSFTVETILLNGPDSIYTDVSGIGGDYCIGMLEVVQADRAGLTLKRDTFPFVNLTMDISAVDVLEPACGGPFGVAQPSFLIIAYDSPGGVFDISNPGVILDQSEVTGTQPGNTPYTLNWANVGTGLDVSNATDSMVTIVIDLTASGYAVFDNLEISASISALSLQEQHVQQSLVLWPNPALDGLQLELTSSSYSWSIHAVDGTVVMQGMSDTSGNIDIASLVTGSYLLQVIAKEGVRIGRFIKE